MLRSLLHKAAKKDESLEEEKVLGQMGLSLLEHCDTFHEKTCEKVN